MVELAHVADGPLSASGTLVVATPTPAACGAAKPQALRNLPKKRRIQGCAPTPTRNNLANRQRGFDRRLAEARQAPAWLFTGTPASASIAASSPDWNISRVMSQPPTNSPLT